MSEPDLRAKPNSKLIQARMQRHWSQEQAATAINVDRKTYNRWERGLSFPRPILLDAACKAYGMSAEDLGFDAALEYAIAESQQHPVVASSRGQARQLAMNGASTPTHSPRLILLQDIIDRNFTGDITDDFLSSNIKTMNFRDEWQYVVNSLVAEEN